jgi:6-hydroxy-3-succinoylpyridine 3-monooxygenase
MPNRNTPPLRTIVYVDGFNFYYGEVRGTPYKWLDLVALFSRVLDPRNALV